MTAILIICLILTIISFIISIMILRCGIKDFLGWCAFITSLGLTVLLIYLLTILP
jgi:hypothetical protein